VSLPAGQLNSEGSAIAWNTSRLIFQFAYQQPISCKYMQLIGCANQNSIILQICKPLIPAGFAG
jgi:hypothetical protein